MTVQAIYAEGQVVNGDKN